MKLMETKKISPKKTIKKGGGVVLLSNYKPKEFGSPKMQLTIDGGQHLKGPPGTDEDQVTQRTLESIFSDPTFDHRE